MGSFKLFLSTWKSYFFIATIQNHYVYLDTEVNTIIVNPQYLQVTCSVPNSVVSGLET